MTLRARILLAVVMLLVILGGAWFYLSRPDVAQLPVEAVAGIKPRITEPRIQNFPTISVASVVGWRNGAKPTPAPGLSVNAFATGLDHPRWLYELPNGDVLVAETNSPPRAAHGIADLVMGMLMKRAGAGVASANRITLLRDTNGDGVADARSVLLSGLSSPFGMALVGDKLFVGNHDALVAFPFKAGQTRITAKPELIVRLPGGGNHWAKNIVPSPDGKLMYVGVGSSTNIAENGMGAENHRANILEVSLTAKTMRIYTAGLRNPVGMAWEPHSQRLWTVVNERDMLGSDLAPDYLTVADFGAFYGWPYTYWGGYVDKRVEDQRPDLLQYTRRPDYALGPHTASLGLAFGSLGAFQDGAFVGQHGSWNRVPVSGYKVVFVPFGANGFPNGPMRDVLTGFLTGDGHAQGRPVGVIARHEGDLLVADDVGNTVWRVSAAR
ncbi:MAG: sorbosone dehydrogenase family protein [Sphingomonadaceae bacterium]|nr:sorbosone dehydrogenase family protein [Sphingomonadaceae bacterium]